MAHSNISIFVPHVGCPHTCSFCNQRTITGVRDVPRAEDVRKICSQAMTEVGDPADTEIAFFGGSFTAIPREYMLELLSAAQDFIGSGKFKGIRISTRPDCIDKEVLELLKRYGVTSIELGAQSMSGEVLKANERGHTAEDVFTASQLIREYGFELGLQVMVGLYRSDYEKEMHTMRCVQEIRPDTVRIYPTCVLKGTHLAELYGSGEYKLMSFDEAVDICAEMAASFTSCGIKILRMGLHASDNLENDLVAGFYHPAFGEVVRSREIRRITERHINANPAESYTVYASRSGISSAVGHKKSNKLYFCEKRINVVFKEDDSLCKDEIRIDKDVYHVFKIT